MAKRKVFSIGSSLSDGLEQTFAAAHHYASELRIDIIPIDKIELDPNNPRTLTLLLEDLLQGLSKTDPQYDKKKQEIESLQSLSHSIIEQGVINPIVVYESNGLYKLIVGERRTLASALAKKSDIQAKILDKKPDLLKIRLLQWIENMERADLSLKERMDNLEQIVETFAKQNSIRMEEVRITDISQLLGCAKSHAINLKAVLNADDNIKQLIADNKIKNLEKAALLCNIQSPQLRSQAIEDSVRGASLKHLKHLLKKDKGKAEENTIYLGSTTKKKVAHLFLESLFKNTDLYDLTSPFHSLDFKENSELISQTLQDIINKLEAIYQ